MSLFFTIAHNNRGYGYLAFQLYRMFHLQERSLPPGNKVNASAKPAEYTSTVNNP